MREPVVFKTYIHKHLEDTYAMPILTIYNRVEYIIGSPKGVTSNISSWEVFNLEFEPGFVDRTEDLLNYFDELDVTPKATSLLKIYFEREERANAKTLYSNTR